MRALYSFVHCPGIALRPRSKRYTRQGNDDVLANALVYYVFAARQHIVQILAASRVYDRVFIASNDDNMWDGLADTLQALG